MSKKPASLRGIFADHAKLGATRVGDVYFLKRDQYIGRSLDEYGEWAQLEIDQLLSYVRPGDFVLDIGANVGFHTLSFARRVGYSGQVWAFEPDPVNALLLRLNVINAGLERTIVAFDTAVSDAHAICQFRTYPISTAENFGHTAIDNDEGRYARISTALDALTFDRPPALIKIDIEGNELPALEGMRRLIDACAPVLSIEADDEAAAAATGAFMADLGYDVYDFVTNAFNPANFAKRQDDIWSGNGRCANLLCVVPGFHAKPQDLPLRKAASFDRAARVDQVPSPVFAAGGQDNALTRGAPGAPWGAPNALRSDIRKFTSGFLRAGLGRLEPEHYGDLVRHALDYIAAESVPAESQALRKMLVSGVEAVGRAIARKDDAAEQLLALGEIVRHRDEQLLAATDRSSRLEVELEAARVSLGASDARLRDTERELENFRSEAAEESRNSVGRIAQLTQDLHDASRASATLEAEIVRLGELLTASQADLGASDSRLRDALLEIESHRTNAVKVSEELSARSDQWDRQRQELEARLSDSNAHLAQSRDAEASAFEASQAEIGRLKAELAELAEIHARSQNEASQRLSAAQAEAASRIALLEAETQSLLARQQQAAAALARSEDEVRRLAEQIEQVEHAADEAEQRRIAETSDLERRLAEASAIASSLLLELAAAREGQVAAQADLGSVQAALASATGELASLRDGTADFEHRLAAQAQEIRRLRALS